MPKKETKSRDGEQKSLVVSLMLDCWESHEEAPELAIYRITPGGDVDRKLGKVEKDKIQIRRDWLKLSGYIALGPDVEDPQSLKADSLQQFRLQQVWAEWAERKEVLVPRPLWEGWLSRRVCVLGR